MARIRANQKNYKHAFKKHIHTYHKCENGSNASRRLILCYCVECGLKCLIMQMNNINKVEQADIETLKTLGSHDLRKLLKAVKKSAKYQFKDFQTEYGDKVTPENFHQMCRYCVDAENQEMLYINKYEKTLTEIAEWLKEVL